MDDGVLEFLLIIPVIFAIVAIDATVVEIIGSQIDTLKFNETLGIPPSEYVIDNASGNVYPEVLCCG